MFVGIVGLFVKSLYEPLVATVANVGLPVIAPHAIVEGMFALILCAVPSIVTVAIVVPELIRLEMDTAVAFPSRVFTLVLRSTPREADKAYPDMLLAL